MKYITISYIWFTISLVVCLLTDQVMSLYVGLAPGVITFTVIWLSTIIDQYHFLKQTMLDGQDG